jgi:hypothetical protein
MRIAETRWPGRALCITLTAGALGACDFITPVEGNPNLLPEATVDQLLVNVTLGAWYVGPGLPAWMQQVDGTTRQALALSKYLERESGPYIDTYLGGGLVSIRAGIQRAEETGRRSYAGIFRVYEAFQLGISASMHGDIPYSEALDPDIREPKLDEQEDVYEAMQLVLDTAIVDLHSDQGIGPGAVDLIYSGDFQKWAAAAYTLKARYHLHWVEVDGDGRYVAALAAAQRGIRDAAGDWLMSLTTSTGERNPWYNSGGSDRWRAGEYMVERLKARSDPRLPYYYSEAGGSFAGTFVGSPPGEPAGDPNLDASQIACADHSRPGCLGIGYGTDDFDLPVLTCAENYLIMAEAHSWLGDDGAARTALDDALNCVEDRWALWGGSVDLSAAKDANDVLVGDALFDEIMEQKYFALFLHTEVWSDYKRTCQPRLVTYNNEEIPGRLLYPANARETNANIPEPSQQPLRNDNDPDPCPTGP